METLNSAVEAKTIDLKFNHLERSARKRGVKFNLRKKDVARLLKKTQCAYSGEDFCDEQHQLDSMSVERINPNRGYVRGNVVAIKIRYNNAISNFGPDERQARIDCLSKQYTESDLVNSTNIEHFKEIEQKISKAEANLKKLRAERKAVNGLVKSTGNDKIRIGALITDLSKAMDGIVKYENLTLRQKINMWFKGEL